MAANDFQTGMQSGAALFAPIAQAQAQANELRLAQQQQIANRLFAQQQLEQQLNARQSISNNELAAREKLQKAQQLFAAKQAADSLAAQAAEAERQRDFTFTRDQERSDEAFRLQQDQMDQNTEVAGAVFSRLNDTTNQLREKLTITDAEREAALANAIQLTGDDAKRTRGEDFAAFFTRVSNDNPEIAAQFQIELQGIQQQKIADPEVLALQAQGRTLGNIFENVTRGGGFDPSFLFTQQPDGQAASDPNDPLAFADSLNALISQGQQAPAQQEGVVVPGSAGILGGALGAARSVTEPLTRSQAPSLDLGSLLFGGNAITDDDVEPLRSFAVQNEGMTDQQFQNLVNSAPIDSDASRAIRELNQKRILSERLQARPTQSNILGVDTKIPIEPGPTFR